MFHNWRLICVSVVNLIALAFSMLKGSRSWQPAYQGLLRYFQPTASVLEYVVFHDQVLARHIGSVMAPTTY